MPAINHIAFYCKNVPAQEAFYSRHFGFKRSKTFNEGQPNEFIMIKLGTVRLEFFPTDAAKVAGLNAGEQPVGFRHLALDVDNIDPYIAAIKAEGIEPDTIIDNGWGVRLLFFRDPEGNILELMEGFKD